MTVSILYAMRVLRRIYRELLCVSRTFDASSGLRASMSLDMLHNEKVRSGGQNAPEIVAYNQHLSEFLQHRTYYLPILPSESHLSPNQNSDATELSHISITNTIRKEFRKQSSAPDAIDTAFLALRSLNEQLEVAKRYGFHPAPTKCVERSCEISGVRHAA